MISGGTGPTRSATMARASRLYMNYRVLILMERALERCLAARPCSRTPSSEVLSPDIAAAQARARLSPRKRRPLGRPDTHRPTGGTADP